MPVDWATVLANGLTDVALVGITAFATYRATRSSALKERHQEDDLQLLEHAWRYVNDWRDWAWTILTDGKKVRELDRTKWPLLDLASCGDLKAVERFGAARARVGRFMAGEEGDRRSVWEAVEAGRMAMLEAIAAQRDRVLRGEPLVRVDRAAAFAALDTPADVRDLIFAKLDRERQRDSEPRSVGET